MGDLDLTKLRTDATVLVKATVMDVANGLVRLSVPDSGWYQPPIIRQIVAQPFQKGDRVRWYLSDETYHTGRFVGRVSGTDKAVVNGGGDDVVVPMNTVHHENLKDPAA